MIRPGEPLPEHAEVLPKRPFQRLAEWYARQVYGVISFLMLNIFRLYESTLEFYPAGTENLHRARESGRPVLVALWHGQALLPICFLEDRQLCLYASQTREPGDFAHSVNESIRGLGLDIMRAFGYQIVDASEYRSEAHGVVKFIHELKGASGGVIAPDGPAGPGHVAKPGVAYIAARAGALILPVGAAVSTLFELEQWDRFEVPAPFARCALAFGAPIEPPAKSGEADLAASANRLQESLESQGRRARALLDSLE